MLSMTRIFLLALFSGLFLFGCGVNVEQNLSLVKSMHADVMSSADFKSDYSNFAEKIDDKHVIVWIFGLNSRNIKYQVRLAEDICTKYKEVSCFSAVDMEKEKSKVLFLRNTGLPREKLSELGPLYEALEWLSEVFWFIDGSEVANSDKSPQKGFEAVFFDSLEIGRWNYSEKNEEFDFLVRKCLFAGIKAKIEIEDDGEPGKKGFYESIGQSEKP